MELSELLISKIQLCNLHLCLVSCKCKTGIRVQQALLLEAKEIFCISNKGIQNSESFPPTLMHLFWWILQMLALKHLFVLVFLSSAS